MACYIYIASFSFRKTKERNGDYEVITYIDNSNSKEYTILFDKASKLLNLTGEDTLTSLEDYYAQLPDLIKLRTEQEQEDTFYNTVHSLGRRLTMLPLDENRFVIDANSRTITVPNDFKKNGIGVQGDELAEVVYFEVDRFFDATDLDTCEIYIQWEAANGDKGASVPWVVDIHSKPDKIIFGWALSSEITEVAGTIKFAVRFYKWGKNATGDDILVYSLSTLTTTANIKPSLDYELANGEFLRETAVDKTIIDRILNSKTIITDGVPAGNPIFIVNLPGMVDLLPEIEFDDYQNNPIKLQDAYELRAQALSPDAGLISYSWVKVLGGDATEEVPSSQWGTKYINTTDTVETINKNLQDGVEKLYYMIEEKENSAELGRFELVDIQTLLSDVNIENILKTSVYELVSWCVVYEVGKYKCVATNRRGKDSARLSSAICEIPMPTEPQLTKNIEKSYILERVVETIVDEETGEETTVESIVPVALGVEATGDGNLAYQWVRVYGETEALEVPEDIVDGTNKDLEVSEIGKYFVTVSNSKNKFTLNKDSEVAKVSFKAEAPRITEPASNQSAILESVTNGSVQVYVKVDENQINNQYLSEKVTYQWYKVVGEQGTLTDDDAAIPNAEGGNNQYFIPSGAGRYACKVTNHLNGTTAEALSKEFWISA